MAIIAFKTNINKITNGSTYAAIPSSPSPVMAITNEIVAAHIRIRARGSSKLSTILDHNDSGSSSSNTFKPNSSIFFLTCYLLSPDLLSVPKWSKTSSTVILWYLKSFIDSNSFRAFAEAFNLYSSPFYIFITQSIKIIYL